MAFPGQEPIVKKGKICPVDITLAQRASNKKVMQKKDTKFEDGDLMFLLSSGPSDVIGGFQIGPNPSEAIYKNTRVCVTGLGPVYNR